MAHRLLPEAEAELDDIWIYIAKQSGSLEIADHLIDSITERFYLLSRNPYIGRSREDDLRAGLRTFPAGEYVIIYRIEKESVFILHIVRGSRNIQALFSH